jgi:hypothetical protein
MEKRGIWSMKRDRELIELAKQSQTLEAAAEHFGATPEAISKMATRLGLTFKGRGLTGLKAKGSK